MTDPECPLTELPAAWCACPKHFGGHLPADTAPTVGYTFPATFPGRCALCDQPITPGQTIIRTAEPGEYVHAEPGVRPSIGGCHR
jgi:hypothetical protein